MPTVENGKGKFSSQSGDWDGWATPGYGDGMVPMSDTDRLYHYLPGDPPMQPVETVFANYYSIRPAAEERIASPMQQTRTRKFQGVEDWGIYYGSTADAPIHYAVTPTPAGMSEWQQISLAAGTGYGVAASGYKVKWKFRVSNAIDRALGYQNARFLYYDYWKNSVIIWALPVYAYYDTAEEWEFCNYDNQSHYRTDNPGWYDPTIEHVTERAYFGGRVDDHDWGIDFLGLGRARFKANVNAEPAPDTVDFDIAANTWYILEYEVETVVDEETQVESYYADYRLSLADGSGNAGASVAHIRWETEMPAIATGKCGDGEVTNEGYSQQSNLYAPGADFTYLDEYGGILVNGHPFVVIQVFDSENLSFWGKGADDEIGPAEWRMQQSGPLLLDLSAEVSLLFGGSMDIEWDWIKVWGELGQEGSGQEGELIYPTPGEAELKEGWTTEMCFVLGSRFIISNSAVMDTLNVYNTSGMLLERNVDWIPDPADETGRAFLITAYPFLTVECTYLNTPPMLPYRPTPPRVMDALDHANLIRADNDIHGL